MAIFNFGNVSWCKAGAFCEACWWNDRVPESIWYHKPLLRDVVLSDQHFRKIQLHSNNKFYRFLLHVCWLFQNHLIPDKQTGKFKIIDCRASPIFRERQFFVRWPSRQPIRHFRAFYHLPNADCLVLLYILPIGAYTYISFNRAHHLHQLLMF